MSNTGKIIQFPTTKTYDPDASYITEAESEKILVTLLDLLYNDPEAFFSLILLEPNNIQPRVREKLIRLRLVDKNCKMYKKVRLIVDDITE